MNDIHCLSNFIDYSPSIHEPLKHSNRIKYTCFDISENYIIFGATSGSLYLFNRRVCKFLHLIPNKHGPVTHLEISSGEKYVAFSTKKGTICVYVINLSANSAPQVIYAALGAEVQVTCIHWTLDEKQFYYGDNRGQVNLVVLNSFIGRSLLSLSVHPILFLEQPVVQIDDFESLLLVSNWSKCILCNTEFEEYKQIGNRLRDGPFGACFAMSTNESLTPSRIYCARPGSRLWEVDFEGEVLQTHQFKAALACPPSKIQKTTDSETEAMFKYSDENSELLDFQPQTLTFTKLQMLSQDFLLTYTELGLYIFDVRTSTVVLWCNQFERIADCRVFGPDGEIVIFTQTGSMYSVSLLTLQSHAMSLVRSEKLLECSFLLKKNLKYFADKAREDYDLIILNHIKNFLIDQQQYELLNDLSVIFDSIAQNEGDTSSGSSAERKSANSGGVSQRPFDAVDQRTQGVYVLENSFCDNLRVKEKDRHFKDALLTVTGKFGKNIIKYKFNIFNDEQKSLVSDLIPRNERTLPFQHVKDNIDEDVVCRRKLPATPPKGRHITDEEKIIYNLLLISRSSQISNTNFLERYRHLFDEYTSREIIGILSKLEAVMLEHGDSELQAKQNCYEMYFNYLNPELIWEVDDISKEFIIQGFIVLNASQDAVRCDNCGFPIRFDNSCQFHELGAVLMRYLWSRNEHGRCFEILKDVPALFDVLAKFYMTEGQVEKIIPIVMNFGQPDLLEEAGRGFNLPAWDRCFDKFVALQQGRLSCINCERITLVENVNRHFFYTWNCFLNISSEFLEAKEILALVYKYSNYIPNDAIDREFFTKCMLK
ncbi:BLOC-2 complex member HPS5 homolog [Episyrphus balteatus]|uniref:BLOC-2 complex member HPS5 homolog n=1 Tax=Episyrphus balteatus TaxID=286459 RepID=UPI0024865F56|nr:BLOC-2 complex member HPS5 homolog [Episyrphus balteatus]